MLIRLAAAAAAAAVWTDGGGRRRDVDDVGNAQVRVCFETEDCDRDENEEYGQRGYDLPRHRHVEITAFVIIGTGLSPSPSYGP